MKTRNSLGARIRETGKTMKVVNQKRKGDGGIRRATKSHR